MTKPDLKGALFFSKEPPHICGYLVINGEEYEIGGWHTSGIRAEIEARQRGQSERRKGERQLDLINDTVASDGPSEPSEGERGQS